MYTYSWYQWLTFFYIYCFFGWMFESAYVSLKSKRFVNRGFLRLPLLPLYGTGAIMMLFVSLPVQHNMILVYFVGVIAATALEYVTGFAMECLFKVKYWDYSNQRFHLNGYICLSSSIAWGFLTIFLTEIIHKPIAGYVLNMNLQLELLLLGIASAFFLFDSIKSVKEALDLGRALESMTKIKGELEEVQLQLALLKGETSVKLSDYRDETAHRIARFRGEATIKVAELKAGANLKISELKDEHTMSAYLSALKEHYRKYSSHMSFYRKSLLLDNPSASSRFSDALKELKDKLNIKHS